jgi:hypothetical protein
MMCCTLVRQNEKKENHAVCSIARVLLISSVSFGHHTAFCPVGNGGSSHRAEVAGEADRIAQFIVKVKNGGAIPLLSIAWQWLFSALDNSAFQTCHNIFIVLCLIN